MARYGKVLCSATAVALAGSVAHGDIYQVYEHLRQYGSHGSEQWTQTMRKKPTSVSGEIVIRAGA